MARCWESRTTEGDTFDFILSITWNNNRTKFPFQGSWVPAVLRPTEETSVSSPLEGQRQTRRRKNRTHKTRLSERRRWQNSVVTVQADGRQPEEGMPPLRTLHRTLHKSPTTLFLLNKAAVNTFVCLGWTRGCQYLSGSSHLAFKLLGDEIDVCETSYEIFWKFARVIKSVHIPPKPQAREFQASRTNGNLDYPRSLFFILPHSGDRAVVSPCGFNWLLFDELTSSTFLCVHQSFGRPLSWNAWVFFLPGVSWSRLSLFYWFFHIYVLWLSSPVWGLLFHSPDVF